MEPDTMLEADLLRRFDDDGFVKVSGLFSAELVVSLRDALEKEHAACNGGERDGDPRYTLARTTSVELISNVWRIVDEFGDLSIHAKLAQIAGQLTGMDRVRIYHDSLLYKGTNGKAVPWHQDEFYALIDNVVTAWVALTPVRREGGALAYARGSHHDGLVNILGKSNEDVAEHLRAQGYQVCCPDMEPGDVLFHAGTIFHGSDRNVTTTPRPAFTVFFFEDGRRLRAQPFGREVVDLVYFPGQSIGDVAQSPLNPLVYDKSAR